MVVAPASSRRVGRVGDAVGPGSAFSAPDVCTDSIATGRLLSYPVRAEAKEWSAPGALFPIMVAALLVVLITGCGGGERNVTEPPPLEPTGFTLTMRAHPEDAAVAQQLGWAGGIPNLEVRIEPVDGGGGVARMATTGADGAVRMDALEPGSYRILATRMLSEAERLKLGSASDVMAFAGEEVVSVSSSSRSATVQLPASYRRSLMISEWAFTARYILGRGTYQYGGYLELYNNGDSTVYLDGVLFGSAFHMVRALPHLSCEAAAPFSNDIAGLWASGLAAFPGSGREYPLEPGGVVVIATDAIDHSVLFPGMLDLSGADFEFTGPADVDNPAVPNMLDVGTRAVLGHGMSFPGSLSAVAVLGSARNPAALHQGKDPVQGQPWLRIDRELVQDILATSTTYFESLQPPPTFCNSMIHPLFDRQTAVLLGDGPDEYRVSISRKVLMTLPDGRPLLQHTRTSANDYQRTPRTPGRVQ